MKKLAKITVGAGALISALYWGGFPVFASLCPDAGNGLAGLTIPGCTSTRVSLDKIVGSVVNIFLFLAFVAALIYLIWGGIKWIMSGGDKEGTNKAKEAVTAALIGLAVVVASYILINIVLQFFGATGGISQLAFPKLQF